MGYTTDFSGSIAIDPPLNMHEYEFLVDLNSTRRMARDRGPLYVKGRGFMGQDPEEDVRNHNGPDPDQPGLWCQWVPNEDGGAEGPVGGFLEWDGSEKFYHSAEWMKYIVENLLAPSARQYINDHIGEDDRLQHFTCDHVLNGEIEAQGEDPGDRWMLVVKDNVVQVANVEITYKDPRPI